MVRQTVAKLGEEGFLHRLLPRLTKNQGTFGVVLGPGDDAAVVRGQGSHPYLVMTTDMLVEDVHFERRWTSGVDLGHKSLAVNLSDLAAMGDVRPRWALVSLGMPRNTSMDFLDGFYRGTFQSRLIVP